MGSRLVVLARLRRTVRTVESTLVDDYPQAARIFRPRLMLIAQLPSTVVEMASYPTTKNPDSQTLSFSMLSSLLSSRV